MAITTLAQLRALYGQPSALSEAKQIDHVDAHCRGLIALAPFVVVATSDGARVDASPKGDVPGFVQVDDAGDVLVPDWPGNRRLDGLRNVLANPQAGLLFMVPGLPETLRVNGAASIEDDEALRRRFARGERLPITVLRVRPAEVFLHCAKAFQRSGLWQPERWPATDSLPRVGPIFRDHARLGTLPDDDEMRAALAKTLY